MKIIDINYERYKIPLIQEFQNSKNKYINQEGLILELKTLNFTGKGEAVLLKGFSKNTLQEIIWSIESFILGIEKKQEYTLDELLILAKIHCSKTPSIQFAIETALYDIVSKENNLSLAKFFDKNSSSLVYCSQILINSNTVVNNDTIKIKVGIKTIEEDIKFLKSLSKKYPYLKIRLDGNQSYSMKDLNRFYKHVSHLNIDFFEEPIKNPNLKKIQDIKNKYPSLNYAIDESVYQNTNYKKWISQKLISTIIIRPSILGEYKKFFKMTKLYNESLQIIISSSLENSIGNMAIVQLASTLKQQNKHGVNIHSFYKNFITPPIYENDKIKLNNIIGLGL